MIIAAFIIIALVALISAFVAFTIMDEEPLAGVVAFIIIIAASCVVGSGIEQIDKRAQIKGATGHCDYRLVTQPDGSTSWERIKGK